MDLRKGKVALITGGSRGIGQAIVRKYVAEGAAVAFTYHSSEAVANALATELSTPDTLVKGYKSDASSYAAAEQLITEVLQDFGKIDVVINNAGVTRDTLLLRMTEAMWDEVLNTNLKSVFNLSKHALKAMLKARSGSIINISSIVGLTGNPGQANYAASKAGIFGFTKSLAKEAGSRNVRCNAIAPGFIETDMTEKLDEKVKEAYLKNIPLNRLGSAEEVADLCVFLGSDQSSYITGQTISICGGLYD
jgi:3-oxoacyl-[acyl-carrier protein] reductase